MAEYEPQGVFNFAQQFNGQHMITVRLKENEAWRLLRELSAVLQDRNEFEFTCFGELKRDAEQDRGLPVV